ncbi:MAG: hypothetical protein ING19_07215 [Azospirillum sp.]|nr:hypothetical protein [Azospirillum sp.]
MLRRIGNKAVAIAHRARGLYWTDYLRRRRPVAYAPYDVSVYRDLLRQLRGRDDVRLAPFNQSALEPDRVNFFLRHDVDTAQCVANLAMVAERNAAESVSAAVYLRCDGDEYRPVDAATAVARCRALGFEVGLHSSAYVQDDSAAALRRELDVFADAFGFAPRSVTIHGLGEFRLAERQALVAHLIGSLATYGLDFTDAHESLRAYDHVITDCHPDPASGKRFIYGDMLRLPPLLRRGRAYLVLTHPCYWKA